LAGEDERHRIFSYLEERFGISVKHFDGYLLLGKKRSWFLIRETAFLETACQLKAVQAGLRSFQRVGEFIKPTTRFIQSFGRHATKARLPVSMMQLRDLVRGERIRVDMPIDNGYVILVSGEDHILGLGLYVNGNVASQLPKKEIRSAMFERIAEEMHVDANQDKEEADADQETAR